MSSSSPSYLKLFQEGRLALGAAMLLSVSLVALDVLIVNTVLPTILGKLGGVSLYAWAIGAYSLGNFITIPIFSTLVSKVGGRFCFLIAVVIFMLGAVVAATAGGMSWIVFGRFLQGLGAGGFFAIPFGLISLYYPAELRPRAVGLVSAVWGAAAVAGPLLGAGILTLGGWRWVFWFNLPAGAVVLLLGLSALRKQNPPPDPRAKLNVLGPLLFALFTGLLLETLVRPFPWKLLLGSAALLAFFFFLKHEAGHASPIIPRDAWGLRKPLGVAFLGMVLATASFGGTETFLPLILQGIWQASPLQAGLILTVGSISWSWTSVWIARYADSPKSLSYLGSLTLGLGLALILATVYLGGPIFLIYFAWFLAGTGMGLMVPTFNTLSLDVADQYPSGTAASALLLALTWGFAIGAPAMGIAANFGFALGFVPEDLGNGILPPLSLQALRLGGSYAILACLILVLFSIFVAQRMPARRER